MILQADCSAIYYDCQLTSNGQSWRITQLKCDFDLFFDPFTLSCTNPENIDDCENWSTTTTKRTTTVKTTTTIDPSQLICKHPGLNPDPNVPRDCNIYYFCKPAPNYPDHWLVTKCHCEEELAFDPELEVCTWPSTLDDCPSRVVPWAFFQSDEDCTARNIF